MARLRRRLTRVLLAVIEAAADGPLLAAQARQRCSAFSPFALFDLTQLHRRGRRRRGRRRRRPLGAGSGAAAASDGPASDGADVEPRLSRLRRAHCERGAAPASCSSSDEVCSLEEAPAPSLPCCVDGEPEVPTTRPRTFEGVTPSPRDRGGRLWARGHEGVQPLGRGRRRRRAAAARCLQNVPSAKSAFPCRSRGRPPTLLHTSAHSARCECRVRAADRAHIRQRTAAPTAGRRALAVPLVPHVLAHVAAAIGPLRVLAGGGRRATRRRSCGRGRCGERCVQAAEAAAAPAGGQVRRTIRRQAVCAPFLASST